ncbi:MAG: hypothetical protein GEU83_14405 [Pseudonocardiaceae bacterium]|nr:hypothetical protein [Pseudonocardiaceae bacterium]
MTHSHTDHQSLPWLDAATLRQARYDGAELIDARPVERFATGHIPGALSLALRGHFGALLITLITPETPVVFVLDEDQDRDELARHCHDHGLQQLHGVLAGGMRAWHATGLPITTLPMLGVADLGNQHVLDVRSQAEWQDGHLPHAAHVPLEELAEVAVTEQVTTLMCNHGQRSMTAASLLARRRGTTEGLSVLRDSAHDWSGHTGCPLQHGTASPE